MALAPNPRSVFAEHAWVSDLRTKRKAQLTALDSAVPWGKLMRQLEPLYHSGKKGRPPIPLSNLLRLHVYQLSFGLSDLHAIEDMLENRVVEAFCQWDITQRPTLSRWTLMRFRHWLDENGRADWLKSETVAAHRSAGLGKRLTED